MHPSPSLAPARDDFYGNMPCSVILHHIHVRTCCVPGVSPRCNRNIAFSEKLRAGERSGVVSTGNI
jgi:hypothetical protein